jgi:hypothetical protein
MCKDVLERFIARANSEGIPLNPPAASVGLRAPGLTAAFLFVLLLVSATLRFGMQIKPTEQTAQVDVANAASSTGIKRGVSSGAPSRVASDMVREDRTVSRQKTGGHRRGVAPLAYPDAGHGWPSQVNLVGPEFDHFDLAVYSKHHAIFRHPFFLTTNLVQDIQWFSTRYEVPRLHFAEPVELAKADQPQLLAEYERHSFEPANQRDNIALVPADAQVLERDFDPDAYRTVLNPNLKRNLPAFHFTPIAAQ